MNAHTPGPWHVGLKQAHRIIYDKSGWAVADATVYHGEESQDEMMANARLIAAAPDLLKELQDFVHRWSKYPNNPPRGEDLRIYLDNARAVIAKAQS